MHYILTLQLLPLLLLHSLPNPTLSAGVTDPVWQTTNLVQTDKRIIINGDACPCTIGSVSSFTMLMSYVGSFPTVPYVMYGVSRYQGSEFLGEEMWELYKIGITNRDVTFLAKIVGVSRIWILEVRYMVISKAFPYLLNTLDNIPINTTYGPLVNITTRSLSPRTFTNTINFTTQSTPTGASFTQFTLPLTNNRIVIFPTTLYLSGMEEPTLSSPNVPINMEITATPISIYTYSLAVRIGVNVVITKLHFSIVFYDYENIFASNSYKMVYEKTCYPVTGGNYVFPPQFQNSFMGAWIEFSTPRTKSVIHFQLDVSSSGATMLNASVPRDPTMTTLSRFCYNLLYLKTWFCPGSRSYDRITDKCSECSSIPGCMDCLNSTFCSTCATALNYFVTASGTCQLCTVTGCTTCSDATTCTLCDATLNYVLTTPTCLLCDAANDIFADFGTQTCVACNLSDCLNCTSLTTCQECDSANLYYLAPDLTCAYCDPTQNYFIDPIALDCNLCTLSSCLTCSNLTACSECNTTADYTINPLTLQCEPCLLVGCLNCTDIFTCQECDLSGNYVLTNGTTCTLCTGGLFANATSDACQVCMLVECTLCASLTECLTCNITDSYYLLPNSTCAYCDPLLNTFINASSLDCQPCSQPGCITCSSLTTCTTCNTTAQYFLNPTTSICVPCSVILVGCVDCGSFSNCVTCESVGYVISASNTCTPICGDGLVRSYEGCDDGNLVGGDGCSSTCTVEIGYVCNNTADPSVCAFDDGVFANELATIERTGCNGFKLITKRPEYPLNLQSQSIIPMTPGVQIASIVQNSTHYQINAQYTQDLLTSTLIFAYTPGIPLSIQYSPTLPPLYYSTSECQTKQQVKNLLIAMEVISYAVLIASILSCKIVGLELFGVLQIAYFSLGSQDWLNIYLEPLTQFRSFNGLNIVLFPDEGQLPPNLSIMQVNSSFFNNFNIMFIVMVVQFVIGLTLYLISKVYLRPKLQKIGLRLLKQGFITLVLFNILNISFSAGIHWQYADPEDTGYSGSSFALYATLIGIVISIIAMQVCEQQQYGEFKNKFKRVWICQLYIPLTICYRLALGLYIGSNSQYQQGTLIILSFSLTFLLYTLINLPFKNVYQNYRCSLIHLTTLYILLIGNYYRSMKSNTKMEIKGKIYGPAVGEFVMIMLCIVGSFFVLLYEIYGMVRDWWGKRKIDGVDEKDKDKRVRVDSISKLNHTEQSIDYVPQ